MREACTGSVTRLRRAILVMSFALSACPVAAHAQQTSSETYEKQRTERVLRERGLQIDPEPENKRILFIELAREDVLVDDELRVPIVLPRFAPTWPNSLHWMTRQSVIRRELLLVEGGRYHGALAQESMRNLRDLGIFSLVRIVPVRVPDPASVGVLVYTRDLWSLRAETQLAGAGSAFQLTTQLVQRNFLGRNKDVTLRFDLDPKAYSLGQAYDDGRVLGGELALSQSFDLILNRQSGHPEGSQGFLWLGRPFYNLGQRWQWASWTGYNAYVARALRGAEVVSFRPDANGSPVECTAPDPSCMRAVWDARSYAAGVSLSHREGERYKQTVSFGASFSDREFAANRETGLRPDQRAVFERELLPKARRQIYPRVGYELWLPDYVVMHDLSTYGQSEAVRVGPSVSSGVSLPLKAFGSSSNSIVFSGSMGYVLGADNALAQAFVSTGARLEAGQVVDQSMSAVLRGATPPWLLGRLVAYGGWTARRRDTGQTQVTLGADSGLRGYQIGRFRAVGGSRLRANLEYRTLPLVLESIHLGGVLFYDAGSVYGALADARLHHDIGAGIRLLFPQFNRTPFRADFGLPLDQKGWSVLVSYGSEQAVPLTAADDAASSVGVRPR